MCGLFIRASVVWKGGRPVNGPISAILNRLFLGTGLNRIIAEK